MANQAVLPTIDVGGQQSVEPAEQLSEKDIAKLERAQKQTPNNTKGDTKPWGDEATKDRKSATQRKYTGAIFRNKSKNIYVKIPKGVKNKKEYLDAKAKEEANRTGQVVTAQESKDMASEGGPGSNLSALNAQSFSNYLQNLATHYSELTQSFNETTNPQTNPGGLVSPILNNENFWNNGTNYNTTNEAPDYPQEWGQYIRGLGYTGNIASTYDYLTGTMGLDYNHTLGLMSNMSREGEFAPKAYNPNDRGGPSGGTFQWHDKGFNGVGRFTDMANSVPNWRNNIIGQVDYALNKEASDGGMWQKRAQEWMNTPFDSPQAAAEAWRAKWEVSQNAGGVDTATNNARIRGLQNIGYTQERFNNQ